ncbi:hypothetical protein [Haloferax sp. DFSO60]|uniref:hypothetical protein n=1 Tax=Haloferax sp. DFSO60 TaxID=3388652 RepID=UPI00397C3949
MTREPPRNTRLRIDHSGTNRLRYTANGGRASDDEQATWRERLTEISKFVTPQKDRQYFRSIYFREPGGVLFEIATDVPGFTVDEEPSELGTSLKLSSWLEFGREVIEATLPPLDDPLEVSD